MKRIVTIASVFAVLVLLSAHYPPFARSASEYEWQNLVAGGKGCFPPACREGQFPMAVMPVSAFDGKLWSVGQKSAWFSADGLNWSSVPKTDWGERHGMSFVFFNGRLWMSGGMKTWDDFRNDVWSSPDGKRWTQVVANAPWSPRRGHAVVVFKNKLWLLGGAESSGRANMTPIHSMNDVWSSDDGIRWTQITKHAPWSPRGDHKVFILNGKLWLLGGEGNSDVWSSTDGETWSLVNKKADWGERRGNGGLVFDGRMWIFGGVEKNDVWSSEDGKSWRLEMEHAP